MLRDLDIEVLSLQSFPGVPEVEEDGLTFYENALKKAIAVSRHTAETVLADDSGLEVDILGGEPGIHSARYSGPTAT
ncbi:MAG: non-canonical purine NTP pyrophosphatase, partial [Syntrophaceae bacterium]